MPGIRSRLFLLVLLPVVPALALAGFTNLQHRRSEMLRVREDAQRLVQLAAANEERVIDHTRQLLSALAQLPQARGSNWLACHGLLTGLLTLYPDYLNFSLIQTNGTLFCSSILPSQKLNLWDHDCFQRVLRSRQFAIGEFQNDPTSGKPALLFAHPVFDENGQLANVLCAALDLRLPNRMIARVSLPEGAVLSVLDRRGRIVARHPEGGAWLGKSLAGQPILQTILTQGDGTSLQAGPDAKPRLCAFATIRAEHEAGLFVNLDIPVAIAYAAANRVLVWNIALWGLIATGAFYLARAYAERMILRPVSALVATAQRLAAGHFDARTGITERAGELAQLAAAFDEMAEKLQRHQAEIQKANENVTRLNAELEARVQQRTTQLEAINRELEAFSYSVSHDLRAPLRHIDGFAQMLAAKTKDVLDDNGRRYVRVIQDAAQRMGTLIDDLLVFSRMGRQEMQQVEVRMEELVQAAMAELENDWEGREVEWVLAEMPAVRCDPALLRQVWLNLISNALKYTRTRPKARIEIGCRQDNCNGIVFFVRDNGVGFEMKYADKLFGVFQRLHRQTEFEGTGIGLANVRRIITRYGGSTWAEAKLDEGATFYFSLPPSPKP